MKLSLPLKVTGAEIELLPLETVNGPLSASEPPDPAVNA